MKYAIIVSTTQGDIVHAYSRFKWLAKILLKGMQLRDPDAIIYLAYINTDPRRIWRSEWEKQDLIDTFYTMVARDDDGVWTTVHDAGTRLEGLASEIIGRHLA